MKTTTEEVIITPVKAAQLLQKNKRNRALNKRIVENYSDQMKRGLWKFNGEPIIISEGGVLLDGQHRLAAIVKSQTTQKMLIVTGPGADVFDTIDTGYTRTAGHILSIADIKSSNHLAAVIGKHYILSNSLPISGANNIPIAKTEILTEYNKAPGFWDEISQFSRRVGQKVSVLSAATVGAYAAYLIRDKKHDKDVVFSFFSQLDKPETAQNSSIIKLYEALITAKLKGYRITTQLQHALIVKTWNAFLKGKEIKVLKYIVGKENMPEFL